MNIFKHQEKMLDCMMTMSEDISKLARIIADQQKQIRTLASCVEQLQDVILVDLEKDIE